MNKLKFIPNNSEPYKSMQFFLIQTQGTVRKLLLSPINLKNLLIMKLILALLLATGLQVVASPTNAQEVTITGNDISLKTIFHKIRKQTGFQFFYNTKFLKAARPVDIQVKNVPVKQVLNQAFKGMPLTYTIIGKT